MTYYYCSGSESSRPGVLDILMDILTQLASTKAGSRIFQDWKRDHSQNALTRIEIHKIILQMVELNGESQTTILINGLDAIDNDSFMWIVDSMQYLLGEAGLGEAKGLLKIFVSSRPKTRIQNQLQSWAKIDVLPLATRSDIEIYIDMEVDRLLKGNPQVNELIPQIKATLKERAGGMFVPLFLFSLIGI